MNKRITEITNIDVITDSEYSTRSWTYATICIEERRFPYLHVTKSYVDIFNSPSESLWRFMSCGTPILDLAVYDLYEAYKAKRNLTYG